MDTFPLSVGEPVFSSAQPTATITWQTTAATGNRRFWPVATTNIDLDALERDRNQLWAEAAAAEATGETLVIDPALWSKAAERAAERLPSDPWEDMLAKIETTDNTNVERVDGEMRVTTEFLLEGMLRFNPAQVGMKDTKRLARVMRRLGWKGPRALRMGDKPVKGYVKGTGKNDAEQGVDSTLVRNSSHRYLQKDDEDFLNSGKFR